MNGPNMPQDTTLPRTTFKARVFNNKRSFDAQMDGGVGQTQNDRYPYLSVRVSAGTQSGILHDTEI